MELASLFLSIVALTVSILFGIRQLRLQNRVTRIEEDRRREEVEQRLQSDLTAIIDREMSASGHLQPVLILHNLGPAAAREVSFDIVGIGGKAPDAVNEPDPMPIPLIDPGGRYRIPLTTMMGVAPNVEISLLWTDDETSKGKELTLGLF